MSLFALFAALSVVTGGLAIAPLDDLQLVSDAREQTGGTYESALPFAFTPAYRDCRYCWYLLHASYPPVNSTGVR